MSPLMYRGKVHKVSSKSWRELPVIGFLAGLRPTDRCLCLRQLVGCSLSGMQYFMPWRYHRAKQLQAITAITLKHRIWFVLKDIMFDQARHTWEEVVLQQSMERSVEVSAAVVAFRILPVYQHRGPRHLLCAQALRVRCQIAALMFVQGQTLGMPLKAAL